eukprot:8037010-Alexandrium_andersonii.AAC.1
MSASLVGSEMCIRDRCRSGTRRPASLGPGAPPVQALAAGCPSRACSGPVSYTHLTLPTICSV